MKLDKALVEPLIYYKVKSNSVLEPVASQAF